MDENTKDYIEEELMAIRDALMYVADLGTVGFIVTMIIVSCGVAAETIYPGLVFNQISPQRLVVASVVLGAMSLLGRERRRSYVRIGAFSLVGGAVATLVTLSAWKYFATLEEQIVLTVAVGLTMVVIFVGALTAVTHRYEPKKKKPQ